MQGLDEFMLRAGHLKVLCNIAVESSTSRFRLERETSSYLTALVEVAPRSIPTLAEYLRKKNLCPVEGARDNDEYRYPELQLVSSAEGVIGVQHISGGPVRVWWQDLC